MLVSAESPPSIICIQIGLRKSSPSAEAAAPVSSMAANSAQILFFIVFPSIRKRPAPFLLFGSAFHAKSR